MCRIRGFKDSIRAQVTVSEFAILLVVIMIALIFMPVYLRRGIQGKLKEGADDIGELYNPLGGTEINTNTTFNSQTDIRRIDYIKYVDPRTKRMTIIRGSVTTTTNSLDKRQVDANETARLVDIP